MIDKPVMIITGTRKGIGKYLAEYYTQNGFSVIGCSRDNIDLVHIAVDEKYSSTGNMLINFGSFVHIGAIVVMCEKCRYT